MESAEIIGLAKSVSDLALKAASDELAPGVHSVDVVVRVAGTFRKGADAVTTVPAKADPWGLLALALSKLNTVTVESLVREHKAFDAEQLKDIQERANAAIQKVKEGTLTRRRGAISSVKLTIDQLTPVSIDTPEGAALIARLDDGRREAI